MNGNRRSRILPSLASGVLGGLLVLVVGAVLLATGAIDSGSSETRVVREASPPVTRQASAGSDGRTVGEIYRDEGSAVVFVQADSGGSPSPLGGGRGTATGSGFVIDRDGTIVTNAHVVEGSDEVQVSLADDGTDLVDAKVLGRDESTDLAVLKVEPDVVEDVTPIPLGDSGDVRVGDSVIAIGNPFGYTRSVTTGIVSAIQRNIDAPNDFTISDAIQTDAAINPGNSGGPLLDAAGNVVGINAQIATGGTEGSVGIGFSIPIDTVKRLIPRLREGEEIQRGYLGVQTSDISADAAEQLDLGTEKGALIQQVVSGGPADDAGLEGIDTSGGSPTGGDVVTRIDGQEVADSGDLVSIVEGLEPGDEVEVRYRREGDERTARVKVGERPASAGGSSESPGGGGGGILPEIP